MKTFWSFKTSWTFRFNLVLPLILFLLSLHTCPLIPLGPPSPSSPTSPPSPPSPLGCTGPPSPPGVWIEILYTCMRFNLVLPLILFLLSLPPYPPIHLVNPVHSVHPVHPVHLVLSVHLEFGLKYSTLALSNNLTGSTTKIGLGTLQCTVLYLDQFF